MTEPAAAPPEEKKSFMDLFGISLPIALTALATTFAGLSTSEMSRAMYWRSAAAQDQSKANDQWSLAGFKRDRSMIVETAAIQLRSAAGYRDGRTTPVAEPDEFEAGQPGGRARKWDRWEIALDPAPIEDDAIRKVLDAIRDNKPDSETLAAARLVDPAKLEQAISAAVAETNLLDNDWQPHIVQMAESVKKTVGAACRADEAHHAEAVRNADLAQAKRLETDARRYRSQAILDRAVGFTYEVRVKISTNASDRHRVRSDNFFYAMLGAQIGATLGSLGMARKHRSAFWFFATLAGMVAISFGVYVYLGM